MPKKNNGQIFECPVCKTRYKLNIHIEKKVEWFATVQKKWKERFGEEITDKQIGRLFKDGWPNSLTVLQWILESKGQKIVEPYAYARTLAREARPTIAQIQKRANETYETQQSLIQYSLTKFTGP